MFNPDLKFEIRSFEIRHSILLNKYIFLRFLELSSPVLPYIKTLGLEDWLEI